MKTMTNDNWRGAFDGTRRLAKIVVSNSLLAPTGREMIVRVGAAFAFATLHFASATMAQTSPPTLLAADMSIGPGTFSSSGVLAGASVGLPLGQGAPAKPAKPKHPLKAMQGRPKS
jgi:hypothetical protein